MPEKPKLPHSYTGGVRPLNIEGRFSNVRARLSNEFTDADREWRKQWLKDQVLAHDEPRFVPELKRAHTNIFRRIYRAPFDALQNAISPALGPELAASVRYCLPKTLIAYGLVVWTFYWAKFNGNDWTKEGGLVFKKGDSVCLPCHADYPRVINRKPQDYADGGFQARTAHLNV